MRLCICSCLLLATFTHARHLNIRSATGHLHTRNVTAEFPDPIDDPFYHPPPNLDTFKPGQVIRSRAINNTITSDDLRASYQVYYRTTDTQNKSEATVGTLWEPNKPKIPQQILSYHSYMDSPSFDCSVSWAFVKGSASQGIGPTLIDAPVFIKWALSKGIYVVDPDDEGPKAAFIAGFQQGQSALDGIRATINFFQLPPNTGIATTGYSGGGSVTAWANNLAGSYAPELNIIGSTHGGTPIDLRSIFLFLNKGPFSGFAGAGLIGAMSAYPELDKWVLDHADDKGKALIEKFRGRNQCIQSVVAGAVFTDFFTMINVTNPLDEPIPKAVLARESLLMDVSSVGVSVPKFPRIIWHASLDEVVPFADEQKFVTQQCQHGANIQFQALPLADHVSAEFGSMAATITSLDQIFTFKTPNVTCGQAPSFFPSIFAPEAPAILGNDTVNSLKKLNGTQVNGQTLYYRTDVTTASDSIKRNARRRMPSAISVHQ